MHEWGYAPTLPNLALSLFGGSAASDDLEEAIRWEESIRVRGDFVYLPGHEHLVEDSTRRVQANHELNGRALSIARQFTTDLVRLCPSIRCVAISGSLASGGYDRSDDIDFDLFVDRGTKYISYVMATLIGLKYSLRERRRRLNPLHRIFFLPKIVCINVVWPENQTSPFRRQDAHVAFELLRCRPIFGAREFQRIIRRNPWILNYFPQINGRAYRDEISNNKTAAKGFLGVLVENRPLRALAEIACRGLVWALYRLVRWSRRRDPKVMARMDYLRGAKWPYEVLQD